MIKWIPTPTDKSDQHTPKIGQDLLIKFEMEIDHLGKRFCYSSGYMDREGRFWDYQGFEIDNPIGWVYFNTLR